MTVTIAPRRIDESEVSWIYRTRNYISHYDARKIYFSFFSEDKDKDKDKEVPPPSKNLWQNASNDTEKRDVLLTALISAPDFYTKDIILDYIKTPETRNLGVALAICDEYFEIVIRFASNDEIIFYLENNQLNDNQVAFIKDPALLKDLMHRIVDTKKVMYTKLVTNFHKIISEPSFEHNEIIDSNFVKKYIEHAHLYAKDEFLEYILVNFKHLHPTMNRMDCLAWDPFTRSRRYTHWLNACNKMNVLLECYKKITPIDGNVSSNMEYIEQYVKYIKIYGGRF